MAWLAKIVSKARLNFVSRSWIKNRGSPPRSTRSISKLRGCCVIQAASGLRVQATYSTIRVPIETRNSTYSRRSQTVSTVKKPQARIVFLCWRRNDRLAAARPRCRRNAGAGEHVPHQRRGNRDPELVQLANDPDVAPMIVLPREAQDQFAQLLVDRWPTPRSVRVRPPARDDPSVPAQQPLGRD